MRRMSPQNTLLLPVIATGVALLALLWVLAIGPKLDARSEASNAVSQQEQRLNTARKQVAAYSASHKRFGGLLVELRRLSIAVPARADISDLLREVQSRARLRNTDLRLVKLNAGTAVPSATSTPTTPTTPGASPGPDDLLQLPFTFSYTGRYFNLLKVLRAVRQAVTVRSGNLSIDGRLLTIDGLTFRRPKPEAKLTTVVLNATAYIAADTTKPPAAADAAAAAAPTKAGS